MPTQKQKFDTGDVWRWVDFKANLGPDENKNFGALKQLLNMLKNQYGRGKYEDSTF